MTTDFCTFYLRAHARTSLTAENLDLLRWSAAENIAIPLEHFSAFLSRAALYVAARSGEIEIVVLNHRACARAVDVVEFHRRTARASQRRRASQVAGADR